MKSNLDTAMNYILKDEGGFAIRSEEGGGAVNMGLTFTVLVAWRKLHGQPVPTFDDLKNITRAEVVEIYTVQYFAGVHFDELPVGPDYFVADMAIHGGVVGSIKLLQEALGAKVDGHYGLATKWAANHRIPSELIVRMADVRSAQYKKFKNYPKIANPTKKDGTPTDPAKIKTWGQIWEERILVVEARCLKMLSSYPVAAVAPVAEPAKPPTAVAPVKLTTTAVVKIDSVVPPKVDLPRMLVAAPLLPAPVTLPAMPDVVLNNKFEIVVPAPMKKRPISNDLSKQMLCVGYTPEQFCHYLEEVVSKQMGTWRPEGIVLHNTGSMKWPAKVFHKSNGVTEILKGEQQLDNMSVHWVKEGFAGAPHLVIDPQGIIWTCWPLNKAGTHSPSWNKTMWGIEMVGDFDLDKFPPVMAYSVSHAMACMFAMLGKVPNDARFKLHKEDPKTKHKRCPGVNSGSKATWLKRIDAELISLDPAGH